MTHTVLHIDTSARFTDSASRAASAALVTEQNASHVIRRDLSETTLPFLDEGFAQATFRFDHPDSQWVLRAMRKNSQLDAVVGGHPFVTFFLDGFTASYVKAMDECGFTGAGVVD